MLIRKKVFFIFSFIILILFFAISNIFSFFLSEDFSDLENREVQQNMIRGTNAFQNNINELAFRIKDWAQWDETYYYAKGENPDFIKNNINSDIVLGLGLNFIVITDINKNTVYKQFFNDSGEEKPFFQNLEKYFTPKSEYIDFRESLSDTHKGVIIVPEGIVVLATTPILPTSGNNVPSGTLTFGFVFDNSSLLPLSELTQLDLSYSLYTNAEKNTDYFDAKNFLSKENSIFIKDAGKNSKIFAYSLIEDINQEPAIILRIEMSRDIYQNAKKINTFFLVFFLLTSIIFLTIILVLVEFLVIRRFLQINKEIKKISAGKGKNVRLTLTGKDEFFQLGNVINKMLDDLSASDMQNTELEEHKQSLSKAVIEHNKELSLKLLELKKINEAMVNRELKMIELKKKISELKNDKQNIE
ncbi:MAG: Diguanylate cyclase with PAS/PAC sensor [Candidatus Falkowbacteria bacterium GW2011_GWC2_38_22]|uniref:Diguanylate cyclase with PAS/PAC sensor n=1 Tax=Candidatus Falkowbacteria bacterium GW2011_GWE1_38_31 TaxID=1618638 RepID=A0A0G0JT30_9BACT|nr:MAG: Diguanylate cyclase with PAS/PAC sensor [Candidatus Falkowbacteria bacterium GW2011_GWF2_38_1205]KKQ61630.1 MAG: Diguanylate cyclase with PAS/PAC sensor [Candidatus Falkowbacteria bacterium GW2011_GWC2_38_22]KKQ63755.1 MAG: Diguanylate cyclase with PAS/PAC sensor [Candidatus Falkowbacteria bacterium GW2011_GWF1_38_22]KKQ65829.1 MAG: Diguanylate cyclase with PAS/PAC sensor [Candidatus Falkowbacteria bacterium GW2011_GWE2_38_254]KKQ70618.1 MAG: Diguanylate cyclase with PAS/PAC sensor [Can